MELSKKPVAPQTLVEAIREGYCKSLTSNDTLEENIKRSVMDYLANKFTGFILQHENQSRELLDLFEELRKFVE